MANFLESSGRRECLLWLGAWSLSGCVTFRMSGGQAVTVPQNAERIYAVTLAFGGPDLETLEWSNRPEGQRTPGPFPLPRPDRMQLGSGFPRDLARPILTFDMPMPTDGPLYEAYDLGFIWAVNEALKTTLDTIDSTAFDYVQGETRFPDGSCGPGYWLLEVVRFVDCHDPARSVAAPCERAWHRQLCWRRARLSAVCAWAGDVFSNSTKLRVALHRTRQAFCQGRWPPASSLR